MPFFTFSLLTNSFNCHLNADKDPVLTLLTANPDQNAKRTSSPRTATNRIPLLLLPSLHPHPTWTFLLLRFSLSLSLSLLWEKTSLPRFPFYFRSHPPSTSSLPAYSFKPHQLRMSISCINKHVCFCCKLTGKTVSLTHTQSSLLCRFYPHFPSPHSFPKSGLDTRIDLWYTQWYFRFRVSEHCWEIENVS